MAQGVVDDLYYVPSKKDKVEQKNDTRETVVVTDADQVVVKSRSPQAVRATAGTTTVVVRDTEGRPMDVDAYNRRYDSSDYDFTEQGDTLYVDRREDAFQVLGQDYLLKLRVGECERADAARAVRHDQPPRQFVVVAKCPVAYRRDFFRQFQCPGKFVGVKGVRRNHV